MASINITPANHSPVISCLGTDDTFVELSFRRLGGLIELIATKVQYNAYTGLYLRDELGREVVANEDAGSVACDLEWKAADALDETDERGVAFVREWQTGAFGGSWRDTEAGKALIDRFTS
jgi:hypothetical protein